MPDAGLPARAGSLTDVRGLRVGHFTEARRPTGCTVVIAPEGAVAGVDVRGAAPGTRETELLSPLNAIEKVHAVMLAGGSAFGLDAASGAMRWLEERGIGVQVGPAQGRERTSKPIRVPIVPAAILFDLWFGDASIRPDAASGYAACEAASTDPVAEGNVGAGTGAAVGKLFGIDRAMRGGIGSASVTETAHDGFARSINPVHTMADGDTIFALATGASGQAGNLTLLGALGAEVMATAVVRAVRAATRLSGPGLPELQCAGDFAGT